MDDSKPLFAQIAQEIEQQIISGALPEDSQVPSTNELAVFYRINPATAAKGVNQLVDRGILYKRRGVGMFVTPGVRAQLLADRQAAFHETYVRPLVAEANALDMTSRQVTDLVKQEFAADSFPSLLEESV